MKSFVPVFYYFGCVVIFNLITLTVVLTGEANFCHIYKKTIVLLLKNLAQFRCVVIFNLITSTVVLTGEANLSYLHQISCSLDKESGFYFLRFLD